MEFSSPPPAGLIQAGSDYFGHWSVAASNFGHTQAEVESWISSALNDSRGWTRVPGLSFTHDSLEAHRVEFQAVNNVAAIVNAQGAIGAARWDLYEPPGPMPVILEASFFGNMDLVNHEACHAFFWATHSVEGTDSIMEPMEDPGEEWPSDIDIAQVQAWLGTVESEAPPRALPASEYWHPLDLPHYITKRPLAGMSEARVIVPVRSMRKAGLEPGATLRAVWATSHAEMLAGNFEDLGAEVSFGEAQMAVGDWSEINAGAIEAEEVYLGLRLRTHLPVDDLSFGQAEVRVR